MSSVCSFLNHPAITRIIIVVGLVPIPMHPKYFLAGFSSFCDRTAKNESLILIPCGGNCVYPAAYNPSICSLAFLIVAVEAITFTLIPSLLHNLLIAA